jgi:hypothetical protein
MTEQELITIVFLFLYGLLPVIACILGFCQGIKDYNRNYFPIRNYFPNLQDKHNQLLSNQPNVIGWETSNEETKVWVRSMPVSLPSSLFGYPTTIILKQASKDPYRGSDEEVIIQKNKHNFFQEVWYGFMARMAEHVIMKTYLKEIKKED